MTIENNKKKESIRTSLNELLIQLEHEKKMITPSKPYIYIDDKLTLYDRDQLELLNITISLLTCLIEQFHSVDDLNSVKKLRQVELFFLSNYDLKKFIFPRYESHIDHNLLDHVNIEIRLDQLSKKSDDLCYRGYSKESIILKKVVSELKKLNCRYFEEKLIDLNDYKIQASIIIDEARPLLEQHRGCKRIFINFFTLISTLGIGFMVNKCVNNRFLFFPETKSSEQLTQLEHSVSQLNS